MPIEKQGNSLKENKITKVLPAEEAKSSHPKRVKRQKKPATGFISGIPPDFEFTKEFSDAFDAMEFSDRNIFVTGKAGTGKSTLLQYFKENTKKNIVVLAPTGVAAINVGGATIHSFFQFPTRLVLREDVKPLSRKRELFRKLDTIVLDEVSMVRADIMDAIDVSLRINRGMPHLPFGGVQMIFIGDLYQLPPVVRDDVDTYFRTTYRSPFFFSAQVFDEIAVKRIELERIFRQTEDGFIHLLNRVRENSVTPEDLHLLNDRFGIRSSEDDEDELAITLTSTNDLASSINMQKLAELRTKEYRYDAVLAGKFEKGAFPTDEHLFLKKEAQVMLLRNDSLKRWVNGSLGIIDHVDADAIYVTIGDETYPVEPVTWEEIEYQFNAEQAKIEPVVAGTFKQYPIKLAWAITIHKSQGKTFDRVIIDFGYGAFAHGQAYVALSRCRTLEGIQLKTRIKRTDIRLDRRVKEYLGEEV